MSDLKQLAAEQKAACSRIESTFESRMRAIAASIVKRHSIPKDLEETFFQAGWNADLQMFDCKKAFAAMPDHFLNM